MTLGELKVVNESSVEVRNVVSHSEKCIKIV